MAKAWKTEGILSGLDSLLLPWDPGIDLMT